MKTRTFVTEFWSNPATESLSKNATLLGVYLMTNEHIGLTPYYQIRDTQITLDTRLTKADLQLAKAELEESGLYKFQDSWVTILHSLCYKDYKVNAENAYEKEIALIPDYIKESTPSVPLGVAQGNPTQGVGKNKKQETRNQKQGDRGTEEGGKRESSIKILEDSDILSNLRQEYPKVDVGKEVKKAINYCISKGKTYKNYVAFMRNWLEKSPETIVVKTKFFMPPSTADPPLSQEQIAENRKKMEEIKAINREKLKQKGLII